MPKAANSKSATPMRASKRKAPIQRGTKAGLVWGVGRTASFIRKGRFAERVSGDAPVFMAGVLEYLSAEVLELAGNVATESKKKTIMPRHIQLAIQNDEEFSRLMAHALLSEGGVSPNIHEFLFPKKVAKMNANQGGMTQEV
eukprot:CAMPEP_0176379446 /NCGR_PEP_ID=MMETSP0126-20121128/30364_1 /TAXON_ID=141414 ORGANISM="Strombidinopsis acuminatum, Strain SPMC142" /NCGR_SAMPLE_ID=MMETSP0126 /ASSEMBLY_ACC=CAM_ASM_000229 /LENGTH=141 /DNA_ID=CAMNT_0017742227 /DNA_START=22 /DNA_END=447 /DNA_ORIENTATION=+